MTPDEMQDEIDQLEATVHYLRLRLEVANETTLALSDALLELRSLVKEGGVPRYTVTPGAALNAVIEESVDPALRKCRGRLQ